MLISSHNLPELSVIADYVILLNEGRIVQQGAVSDLLAAYRTDLTYELSLFEGDAATLASVLQERLQLDCETVDTRRLKLSCADPNALHSVLCLLAKSNSQYRIREIREEQTPLESVFYSQLAEGSPE